MPKMMGSRAHPRGLWCALALSLLALPALADPPPAEPAVDGATRATARQLGYDGIQDYQREDFRSATDKLERAYKMLKAPSLALWSARALEKSGKFVEAAERYLEATRLPDDVGGEAAVQQKSRDEAKQDRDALLPRIPALTIHIEGAAAEGVALSIRGEDVPSTVVGSPRPTNPGDAVVEGRLGEQTVKQKVALMEAEKKTVTLHFEPAAVAAPAAATSDATTPEDTGPKNTWQRPVGWVGVGLGAAGIAVGAIAGGVALSQQRDDCPNGICDSSVPESAMTSYNTMRDVSTIGFIAGGVLAAAGVTLLITAPKAQHASASLQPYVGLTSAGLRGTF